MDFLTTLLLLVVLLAMLAVGFLWWKLKNTGSAKQVEIHSSIEKLKAIGELSVFKAVTKEIVTQFDHDWGDFGKKWLGWLYSSKKMAMIFEFEINFRYDLRKSDFEVINQANGAYVVKMPPCFHEVHIRSISFYDEQGSKLMPWLLPDTLNGLFGKGFGEEEKNQMVAMARAHAEGQALRLISGLTSEVEESAKVTLTSVAKAFGAQSIRFEFAKPTGQVDVQMDKAVA